MEQKEKKSSVDRNDETRKGAWIQGMLGLVGAIIGAGALIYAARITVTSNATATVAAQTERSLLDLVNAPTNTPLPTQTPYPTYTSLPPYPTYTPRPTYTLPPEPTGSFTSSPTLLYEADWSESLNGWAGPHSWKTAPGMLISDGSDGSFIMAPFESDLANYAVEAELQEVSPGGCGSNYGIVTRRQGNTYYKVGFNFYCGRALVIWAVGSEVEVGNYKPGTEWNTYRVEMKDNNIRLLINGAVIMDAIDNRYLSPGQVGLWSEGSQINVRSFKIFSLDK